MRLRKTIFFEFFIAAYISLFMSFSSAIWHESAHHDNTRYFRASNSEEFKSSCFNDGQYSWLYIIGRPVTAEIECQVFKYTRQLSDLAELRTAVIGFVALASATLGLILVGLGFDKVTSILISIAIFTLPGMQNAVFMTNFPNAISPFLALLAFLLFNPVKSVLPWAWNGREMVRALLAFGLLVCSALVYPALAFVFFWGAATRTLTDRNGEWLHHIKLFARDTMLFGTAMVSSLVLSKALVPAVFKSRLASVPEHFQADFSITNLIGKIPFLFCDAIPTALSLWLMQKGIFGYTLIFSIVLSAIVLFSFPKRDSSEFQINSSKIVFIFLFAIFTFTPLVLSRESILHQRVLMPSMGLFVILAIFLISTTIDRIALVRAPNKLLTFRLCAFIVVSFGLIISSYSMAKNVWNTNVEMMFVRSEFYKLNSFPRRIHLIRPVDNNIGFNGLPSRTDEFNRKTTDFKQDIIDFLRLSLFGSSQNIGVPLAYCDPSTTDCELVVPESQIIVSFSEYEQKFCRTRDMALIDMNVLVSATHTGNPNIAKLDSVPYCEMGKFQVSTEPKSTEGAHSISKAFDNSTAPNDFWESSISGPVTVNIAHPSPITLKNYSFSAGEAAERMPLNWFLYASNDLKAWHLIDSQENIAEWKQNEQRSFSVKLPKAHSYFRIVFTKSNHPQIMRIYEIKLNG